MKKYIRCHLVEAKPCTLGEWEQETGRTWNEPDRPRTEEGYKCDYPSGYSGWCPKAEFDKVSHPIDNMTFGMAIEALKNGYKVARAGWNGKGMFVVYQKGYPEGIPCNKQTAEAYGYNEGDLFKCRPYMQMRCADGTHQMWLASQSDILENDWYIVE
jgi:hypothetical protein